jgi:uroporphyrinogen-III synthase
MSNDPDHIQHSNLRRPRGISGTVFICTYPKKGQDELVDALTAEGATVLSMPVIEVTSLPFQPEKEIEGYDWLVFTSKNAVEPFASKFPVVKNKVAALGEQTAKKLQQFHIEPEFTGSGKSADDFAQEFLEVLGENEKVLLVLGNLAPNTLQQKLSGKATVDRIDVYQTTPLYKVDEDILDLIKKDKYDALVVTSPSAIKTLVTLLKNPHQQLRLFSIGKTTTNAILDFQMQPLATSVEPSYRGLAQTILDYFKNKE